MSNHVAVLPIWARATRTGTTLTLLGLLLSLAACPPPPLQTTWPKFHHDILQTGLSHELEVMASTPSRPK